ncbi:MAG: hypothetical protein J6R79_02685 [Bacteroidaceae bacterium]|nr:hypothetical protein [Bacteroidaceae bacterium]
MIITDINQIDRIAEETFGNTKGIVTIDMTDYASFKKRSTSLKVVQLDVSTLTEDVVLALNETLIESGIENVSDVLLYFKGNGSDEGIRAITVEQFNMFFEAFNKHFETANIIWGMGDDSENKEKISILIFLGYGKGEKT